jgi:hypothetical protein
MRPPDLDSLKAFEICCTTIEARRILRRGESRVIRRQRASYLRSLPVVVMLARYLVYSHT